MKKRVHGAKLLLSVGTAVTLAIGMLVAGQTAYAAGPTPVDLGTAGSFAVLAGTAVTSTGSTTITGDVGVHPGSSIGILPASVTGTIHAADATALQAKSDLGTAYDDASGRTPSTVVIGGILGGQTLVGGVYNAGGFTLDLTGTLTLNGQNDPASVWIFQATSDLIVAGSVKLINGASSCNVFWQVTSSATLGSGSAFMGTIMALTSITMADGVTMHGAALARNGDVTLIGDTITNTCSIAPVAPVAPVASASPSAAGSAAPGASASPTSSASPAAAASPASSATPASAATPAAPAVTPAPTSTVGDGSSNNSTLPLLPLLIIGFAGTALAIFEAQRRSIRS